MTEEIKNEIRQAVNDSLIDAIKTANESKSKSVTEIFLTILQIALVPLIGWLLLNSVEIQKDIVLMRYQLAEVNNHLQDHMDAVENRKSESVILHHSNELPDCTTCHKIKTVRPVPKVRQ